MTKVLCIANQKGGVGKTTTALTLAAALSRMELRVLVIDLDPHACATIHLAFYPEQVEHGAFDLFTGAVVNRTVWEQAIQPGRGTGFDFVPSHVRLSDLEGDLKGKPGKGLILRRGLTAIEADYDHIILDCPPNIGVLMVNALVASNLAVIPIQTDFLALHGLKLMFDTMRMLNRVMPHPIEYRALATMYDRRAGACRRVLNLLRRKMGTRLLETVINIDTKFREASGVGKTILDIAPDSRGSVEYQRLAREIQKLSQ